MRCGRRANATDWGPLASAADRESPSCSSQFTKALSGAHEEAMKQLIRMLTVGGVAALAASCASVGGGPGGTATNGGVDQTSGAPNVIWPVKTREHVDLWLHGFAMLQEDTTFVPFFKRGYSTNMIVLKNRANVVTQLDANRDNLRA